MNERINEKNILINFIAKQTDSSFKFSCIEWKRMNEIELIAGWLKQFELVKIDGNTYT